MVHTQRYSYGNRNTVSIKNIDCGVCALGTLYEIDDECFID